MWILTGFIIWTLIVLSAGIVIGRLLRWADKDAQRHRAQDQVNWRHDPLLNEFD